MMDKNNRSTLGKKELNIGSVGLVPFQGIGTRLRRSRSKDHSTDQDNLSNDLEISNLKHLQQSHHQHPQQQQFILGHNNGYDGLNLYSPSSGTLERTKRFYGNTQPKIPMFDHQHHNSSFINSSIQQQQLYVQQLDQRLNTKNGSSSALYEDSQLLSHQYEEPQYLIDVNYRARQQQQQQQKDLYGKFGAFNHQQQVLPLLTNNSIKNHRNYTTTATTSTIIPPSKLFAQTLSSSSTSCKFYLFLFFGMI